MYTGRVKLFDINDVTCMRVFTDMSAPQFSEEGALAFSVGNAVYYEPLKYGAGYGREQTVSGPNGLCHTCNYWPWAHYSYGALTVLHVCHPGGCQPIQCWYTTTYWGLQATIADGQSADRHILAVEHDEWTAYVSHSGGVQGVGNVLANDVQGIFSNIEVPTGEARLIITSGAYGAQDITIPLEYELPTGTYDGAYCEIIRISCVQVPRDMWCA